MLTKCKLCSLEFNVKQSVLLRGDGLFCGRKCYGEWQKINKPKNWGVNDPNFDKEKLLKIRKNHSACMKGKPSWCKGKKLHYMPPTAFKKGDNLGDKHPGWKGGKSLYWKKLAKIRDNFTCMICGFSEKDVLEVHHIVPVLTQYKRKYGVDDINNMITLCPICHVKIHKKIVKLPIQLGI